MNNLTENEKFLKILNEEMENISFENEDAGVVISSFDGMCIVRGLRDSFINEIVVFDNGVEGIVISSSNENCTVFVFEKKFPKSGEGVRRTKNPFSLKINKNFLGRVVDIFGEAIDGEKIDKKNFFESSIENDIPGIIERKSVSESFVTGIIAIDSVIPIGKGQRQLFIGSRSTGKTSTILDIIVNQKNFNTICVYVAIGQKKSDIVAIKNYFEKNGIMENCIIVSSSAEKLAINHYLSPYVGITIAEYFSKIEKKDILIIYDDLTNHAISYREVSLLMKNSPAREAYPADIFYSHARLLERSGCFKEYGSITAFPIVQLQEDDITAYIPTNLISITDGQVFFDTKLFNNGIFPAINTELSVSRVGGAAQSNLIKNLSKSLRLELAQFHELSVFSQFGADLDEQTKIKIENGKILIELLTQPMEKTYTIADQAIILFLFRFFIKNLKEIKNLKKYIFWIIEYIKINNFEIYSTLNIGNSLTEENRKKLEEIIKETFVFFN